VNIKWQLPFADFFFADVLNVEEFVQNEEEFVQNEEEFVLLNKKFTELL